jgi:hypothetical protein
MSNVQVALHLSALLLIYALASKLDEASTLPVHRPLAQSVHARCMLQAQHRATLSADAASASTHAAQPIRVAF